jgi:hypothetical protein
LVAYIWLEEEVHTEAEYAFMYLFKESVAQTPSGAVAVIGRK